MKKSILICLAAMSLLLSACSNKADNSSENASSETNQTESIGANNSSTYDDEYGDNYITVEDYFHLKNDLESKLQDYKEKGYTIDEQAGYVYTNADGFVDDHNRTYGSEGIVLIERLTDEKVLTIPEAINGQKVVACLNDVFLDFDQENNRHYVPCEKIYFPKDMQEAIVTLPRAKDLVEVVLPQNQSVIVAGMFNQCEKLSSIELPDSVEVIGEYAFRGCESLNGSLALPKSLITISFQAFEGCKSITEIQFNDKLEEIGSMAFTSCRSLTKVTLPKKVKHIGSLCFERCTSLCEITLPESLTEIGKCAFSQTKITRIVIPSKITVIEPKTFNECSELSEVVLNDGLQRIEVNAFKSCTSLKEIYIPATVEYISEDAFNKCEDITIKGESGSYAEKYAKEQGFEFVASNSSN